MSARHTAIHHFDVPDHGELYESGVRVVIVQGQDGTPDLERGALGTHFVMSCHWEERDGVSMLNVGLMRVLAALVICWTHSVTGPGPG